jgi:hypothetical protein
MRELFSEKTNCIASYRSLARFTFKGKKRLPSSHNQDIYFMVSFTPKEELIWFSPIVSKTCQFAYKPCLKKKSSLCRGRWVLKAVLDGPYHSTIEKIKFGPGLSSFTSVPGPEEPAQKSVFEDRKIFFDSAGRHAAFSGDIRKFDHLPIGLDRYLQKPLEGPHVSG